MIRLKYLGRALSVRRLQNPGHGGAAFSGISGDKESEAIEKPFNGPGKVIYEGSFAGTLKRLRRVSIVSAIGSAIGLPIAYVFGIPNASISIAGQVGIIGTVLVSSLSSTFFLQLVTSPYVTQLREWEVSSSERCFRADRLNYFGNSVQTTFTLSEVSKVTSSRHPYASCVAKDTYMYFHDQEKALDPALRERVTNG